MQNPLHVRTAARSLQLAAFVCVGLVWLFVAAAKAQAAIDPKTVLDSCDKSLDAAQVWSMQVTSAITATTSPRSSEAGSGKIEYRGTYVRDHARAAIDMVLTASPVRAGASRVGTRHRAFINGYMLTYTLSPEGQTQRGVLFSPDGEKFARLALASMVYEEAMEGWLIDPEPVTQILRACTDLSCADRPETVDGHACVAVAGTSRYGRYALWCDPQLGYFPRKISVLKKGADVIGRTTIEKERLKSPAPDGGYVAPQTMQITADEMRFQTVDGITLPVGCRVVERHDFGNDTWHERQVVITREQINLHPDLSRPGLFTPELPEGTVLSNQSDLKAPYEWHQGRPLPRMAALVAEPRRPVEADTTTLVGKQAPEFSLPALEGQKVTLSGQKGKVVVLDFWATWCPPCRASMPHAQQLSRDEARAGKGLVVWLIDDKEDEATVKKFLNDNHYAFVVPMDLVGEVLAKYKVRGIPTTVVIGRNGVIRKVVVGYGKDTGKAIDAAVDEALAEGLTLAN